MKRDRAQHVRDIAKLDAALAALGSNGAGPRRGTMSAATRKSVHGGPKPRNRKRKSPDEHLKGDVCLNL
jgi:hypothetical protein